LKTAASWSRSGPATSLNAVLEGVVGAHVVNHAFRCDDDAVAALLDALEMLVQTVFGQDPAIPLDPDGLPEAAEVRGIGMQGLSAAREDGRRHLAAPATGRRVRHRYFVRLHHANAGYSLPISVRAVASRSDGAGRPLMSNVIRLSLPVKANGGS
jgi:hypothetical protein